MGADEVAVVDPAVVDVLVRLHRRLQLLDDVAFLDVVVRQVDPGDLAERLGQRLALVDVGVERLRDDVDLHALERLRRGLRTGQLLDLLVPGQRRGLELVDPLVDGGVGGVGADDAGHGQHCTGRRRAEQEPRLPRCHLVIEASRDTPPVDGWPHALPPVGKQEPAVCHGVMRQPKRITTTNQSTATIEPPQRQRRRREPAEMDPGAAEQADEQPVAARRRHRQEAAALDRRPRQLQAGHEHQHQARSRRRRSPSAASRPSWRRGRRGGSTPCLTPGPGRSPWPCSCARTRSPARPAGWSHAGGRQLPSRCRRPRRCASWWRRSAWR